MRAPKSPAAFFVLIVLFSALGRLLAAAPVLLQSGCVFGGNNDTNNSSDVAIPRAGGRTLLLIRIQADSGSVPPASVAYDGTALIPLRPTKTSDSGYLQTWYLVNPTAGDGRPLVVVSKDGFKGHSWNVVAEVYGGVDTADPFGAKAHGVFHNSAVWSLDFKTRYDNSMIDDFLEVASNPASFVPGGQQVLDAGAPWCGGGTSANRGDHLTAPKAGKQTLTYTLDGPKAGAYQILEIKGLGTPPVFSVSAQPACGGESSGEI